MDKPDLCPAGHSLVDVNTAHEVIIQHVRDLDSAAAVAELRCFGANLITRLAPVISSADEIALRVFVSIAQRFDAGEDGEGDLDQDMPPFVDAIKPGSCSCHDELSLYRKLDAFTDAQRAHALEHRDAHAIGTSQN